MSKNKDGWDYTGVSPYMQQYMARARRVSIRSTWDCRNKETSRG
jgi:hypothetical protein